MPSAVDRSLVLSSGWTGQMPDVHVIALPAPGPGWMGVDRQATEGVDPAMGGKQIVKSKLLRLNPNLLASGVHMVKCITC